MAGVSPSPRPAGIAGEGAKHDDLAAWKSALRSRRTFLIAAAGGLAALFAPLRATAKAVEPWPLLDAVQQHLLPTEPDAPGAREIHALDYLRGVLADPRGDREVQHFILKGVDWLDDLARTRHQKAFLELDPDQREAVLREVADSEKGDNWISTLMVYLCEALLGDPSHGGNPGGIGWTWLRHQPGFPRPTKAEVETVLSGRSNAVPSPPAPPEGSRP
jgi:gluconate 2-dehydrogenase gamma chain